MTYQNNLNMLERVVNLLRFLGRAVPTIDQYCLVTRQQKLRRLRPSSLRRWPSTCAQRNETRLPHRRCRGEQKTRERYCDSTHTCHMSFSFGDVHSFTSRASTRLRSAG